MGAAKKLEMFPDEAWLAERVKDGRAKRMAVSMKAIGKPDVRLQQRAEHLDVGHVHRLDRMRLSGTNIFPVVLFWDDAIEKYYLADGFHRHEMYRRAKLDAIPAYVIQGTWRDAMIYSTMCNQLAILNRKPEDIKKAVFTLLDDEEWWKKSDKMIGGHCGLSHTTVGRYRREYSATKNVPLPKMVKSSDGIDRQYSVLINGPRISKNKNHSLQACIGGKRVTLPRDANESETMVNRLVQMKADQKHGLEPRRIRGFFSRRNILFVASNLYANSGLGGVSVGSGVVFVSEPFSRTGIGRSSPEVPTAVGRILLARQLIDPTARAVVVCYTEDAPPELIEAGRALGVEFLTPDELVASIKGDDDAAGSCEA